MTHFVKVAVVMMVSTVLVFGTVLVFASVVYVAIQDNGDFLK